MVAIRDRCFRNLKIVGYVIVFSICAHIIGLFLFPKFTQKSVPTQAPGIHTFNGTDARKNSEDTKTTSKIQENDQRLMERQVKRRERVQQVCEELRRNSSHSWLTSNKAIIQSAFHSLYVDDKHRLLYCTVPKVACTNWKRVLLTLSGRVASAKIENLSDNNVHLQLGRVYLKRLESYTAKEIQFRLNNYYKFMFVREPFERLLSAYRNKLASAEDEEFRRLYGREIIRRYRSRPSGTSLQRGHDVTFEEFVRYLLDPKTTSREMFEPHWRPYHQGCHPCYINYDFIGKYETLDEDVDFVLRCLGVRHLVAFPTKVPRTSKELVAKQFANISRSDIHRLWKIYSLDFHLFEYKYPAY